MEVNDKVWNWKKEPEKGLVTLAILYERFEQVSSELADIDKKSDKEFEDMKNAKETSKEAQRLAEVAMDAILEVFTAARRRRSTIPRSR